jgi:hypothetical protein
MAITLDGTTPAQVTSSAGVTSETTASFSPPSACIVVIMVNVAYSTARTTAAVTVKDSLSNAYTQSVGIVDTGGYGGSFIFTQYYASAPGSITVTATSNFSANMFQLVTEVLDGCAAGQAGAAVRTAALDSNTETATESITSTIAGSRVLAACVCAGNNIATFTASGLTTISTFSAAPGSGATGYAATGTPGAETIGWTLSSSSYITWAALEILPFTTVTAGASLSGSGSMTSAGASVTVPETASLDGEGSMTVSDMTYDNGAASLSGSSVMTSEGADLPPGSGFGLLSGSGTMTAGRGVIWAEGALLSGSGTMTPLFSARYGNAILSGSGSISNSLLLGYPAALSGSGTMTVIKVLGGLVLASSGDPISYAYPGTSQVAVAAPGSSDWMYLGQLGIMTALTYSYACPGGCDQMTATIMVPAAYRTQMFNPGWQVRITRGGHQVWDGKMDEPVPTADGWTLSATGTGNLGQNFVAMYTSTWPSGEPDQAVNAAIARGLPWINPGVGTPAGAWYGQEVDPGAQTITALLNLICTRGGLTWYVNSQPGGYPGDDLSVFPLPTVPNRLLVCSSPVARTLGGDINTIWIRYESSADTTSTSGGDTPAVYATTSVSNAASVAAHGVIETYIDLSDAGVMDAAAAAAVGNAVLSIYVRASFAGPFTAGYGQLLNTGGAAIDPGTDQAATMVRLILTDYAYGGEVTPQFPVTFIVGAYEWDDFAEVATITPYQSVDQSLTGLLSLESSLLTPIAASS